MYMKKPQLIAILAALGLFLVLYFGFSTKNDHQTATDHSRALTAESLDIEKVLKDAEAGLDAQKNEERSGLLNQLNQANAGQKVEILKQLSGFWYRNNNILAAAHYAENAAQEASIDSIWSVSGALYYEALNRSPEPETKEYAATHAIKSFESAISLQPKNVEHRVNLALVYAEHPPKDNPMQAVLMLRDLEKQYPEEAAVYNALGRLAIKTGQWEKAITRLEQALKVSPQNPNTPCLLAKAWEGAGNTQKASEYAAKCKF